MRELHVVGAAIKDGNLILAAQRSSSMEMPLKWEFVGGKVEKNETHQQALEREVNEELGIRIGTGRYIATGYSYSGTARIVLYVYETVLLEGTPVAKEHANLKWVYIDELAGLDWAEADIPACRELISRYGTNKERAIFE